MLAYFRGLLERWLALAARRTIERERPFIVAITGSVGKSSTRQAIAAVLQAGEHGDRVRASAKNYNNELGVPLTVFDCPAPGRSLSRWFQLLSRAWRVSRGYERTGIKTFVLEMGADREGDLAHLTSIAKPDISVVTAVTPEDPTLPPVHLAKYPSLDALAKEKATLVREVRPEGAVILNADDARVFAMRHQTHAHVLTYGETDAANVRLLRVAIRCEDRAWGKEPVGLELTVQLYQRQQVFYVPGVFGRSLAYAWGAAFAVAEALDVTLDHLDVAVTRFAPLPGRVRIIPGRNGVTIFDDSYNASPAAMLAGLRDLGAVQIAPNQRRIAVIGEMREIGSEALAVHRRMGAEAAHLGLDLFIPCGTFAPVMKEGALANGMKEEQIIACNDTLDAIPVLESRLQPGDILFAKASEGPLPSSSFKRTVMGVRMDRVVKAFMAEPERASELLCRQEARWR